MGLTGREVRIRNCPQKCQAHFAIPKSSLGGHDVFSDSLCQSLGGVLSVLQVFVGSFSSTAKRAFWTLTHHGF